MCNPTEENIHQMRTSLRRLEATYRSSPRQFIKRNNVKVFAKRGKKLFRINSRIRDIDIILEKLNTEGKMPDQELKYIERSLKHEKQLKLKEARAMALDLKEINVSNVYYRKNINKKFEQKSKKRILKMVNKLKTKIELNIPLVISDDTKILELHGTRKDAKKLRYLIELLLYNRANVSSNKGIEKNSINSVIQNNQQVLVHLEKIQEILGNIHDYDITIDYLNNYHIFSEPHIADVIANIEKIRKTKFDEFVNYITLNNNQHNYKN